MNHRLPNPFVVHLEAPEPKRPMPNHTIMILEGHHPDELGLIPSFLDPDDPRPAREQFDENYAHGGGWIPIKGFVKHGDSAVLEYKGDPPYEPIAAIALRDEMIIVYRYGLVAILARDGSYEVARMD